MDFWEPLPDQCPPADAVEDAIDLAFRLVFSDPASIEHFKSHAALGLPKPPAVDGCRFSSCSLFTSKETVTSVAGLPKMRAKKPLIAQVSVPQGSGRWISKGSHIDFWIYAEFDPLTAITKVEAI